MTAADGASGRSTAACAGSSQCVALPCSLWALAGQPQLPATTGVRQPSLMEHVSQVASEHTEGSIVEVTSAIADARGVPERSGPTFAVPPEMRSAVSSTRVAIGDRSVATALAAPSTAFALSSVGPLSSACGDGGTSTESASLVATSSCHVKSDHLNSVARPWNVECTGGGAASTACTRHVYLGGHRCGAPHDEARDSTCDHAYCHTPDESVFLPSDLLQMASTSPGPLTPEPPPQPPAMVLAARTDDLEHPDATNGEGGNDTFAPLDLPAALGVLPGGGVLPLLPDAKMGDGSSDTFAQLDLPAALGVLPGGGVLSLLPVQAGTAHRSGDA